MSTHWGLQDTLPFLDERYGSSYQVPSQAEAEAGTATAARVWTAERVKQAIEALAPSGGGGGSVGYGEELAYDEITSSVNTTNTVAGHASGIIAGLSITVEGTGRPVDIEFQALITHSVANTAVTVALLQDGVNTGFYAGVSSPSNSLAMTLNFKRRLAGWTVGVSRTFEISLSGAVAGTVTILTTSGTSPAHLMATGR